MFWVSCRFLVAENSPATGLDFKAKMLQPRILTVASGYSWTIPDTGTRPTKLESSKRKA